MSVKLKMKRLSKPRKGLGFTSKRHSNEPILIDQIPDVPVQGKEKKLVCTCGKCKCRFVL